MKQIFVATIQVAVDVANIEDACDLLSERLSELHPGLIDWQYLPLGGQYCYPTAKCIEHSGPEYTIGEAFQI